MSPSKVEYISRSAPFITTEGERYGKRPINLDQPMPYIAAETALYFRKNLYSFDFDPETNSLLVIMTDGLKVRIKFRKE